MCTYSENNRIRLFCFPYAGGSASIYMRWKKYLSESIDLCPIELPGRGSRFNESLLYHIDDLVCDIYEKIYKDTTVFQYALLGHSLGSLLAYELAVKLRDLKQRPPQHIFFSGAYPPYINKAQEILHQLDNSTFIKEIFKFGGMPEEIQSNSKFMDMFIPILKSDYRAFETYKHNHENVDLGCDITVFSGVDDENVTFEDVNSWRKCTTGKFESHTYEGGHFFILNSFEKVAEVINKNLLGDSLF